MKLMETIIIRAADGLSRSILQRLADEIMPNKPSEGLGTLIKASGRVLSTECILCQTCSTVCPKSNITMTNKWDVCKKELIRRRS